MHIFSKKNSSLFLTAAMLIAAASCTQELQENDLVKPSDDVVLTKAVNTPEDALEGNLIVKLSEETAGLLLLYISLYPFQWLSKTGQ